MMKLYNFLKEELSENFDLDQLSKIKSWQGKVLYANKMGLKKIAEGSARYIYDMGDKVLKIQMITKNAVKNKENETEIRLTKCAGNRFFPIIYDSAPDGSWLIAEKVKIVSIGELNSRISAKTDGLIDEFYILEEVLLAGLSSFNKIEFKRMRTKLKDSIKLFGRLYKHNDWFTDLFDTFQKCQISAEDLHEENFGIRANGDIVIIDIGFDLIDKSYVADIIG